MKTRMVEERIGEDMGPIDWNHETAKGMPQVWRDAEKNPREYAFVRSGGLFAVRLLAIRMYDGWPYWTPRPAILFSGPLGPEWNWFDSYGVHADSIVHHPGPTYWEEQAAKR